jgi:hypothetical protein
MPTNIDNITIALQEHLVRTPQEDVTWMNVFGALMAANFMEFFSLEGRGQTVGLYRGEELVNEIVLGEPGEPGVAKVRAKTDQLRTRTVDEQERFQTTVKRPTVNKVMETVARYVEEEVKREPYRVSDLKRQIRLAFVGKKA